jgi:hypothetical protein
MEGSLFSCRIDNHSVYKMKAKFQSASTYLKQFGEFDRSVRRKSRCSRFLADLGHHLGKWLRGDVRIIALN